MNHILTSGGIWPNVKVAPIHTNTRKSIKVSWPAHHFHTISCLECIDDGGMARVDLVGIIINILPSSLEGQR
ncbi:MAG: hypothetical protein BWY95_02695 [Bacteroidetes bacterium ADurb.BinA104]|nr:MAG: hypothetical protein BWY95_02695 [Bacteroidetes bacterium ADurb.BinA104]